jgi:hypothetical protein
LIDPAYLEEIFSPWPAPLGIEIVGVLYWRPDATETNVAWWADRCIAAFEDGARTHHRGIGDASEHAEIQLMVRRGGVEGQYATVTLRFAEEFLKGIPRSAVGDFCRRELTNQMRVIGWSIPEYRPRERQPHGLR